MASLPQSFDASPPIDAPERTNLSSTHKRRSQSPARVAICFLVLSVTWILVTDTTIHSGCFDETTIHRLQSIKGIFFVSLSTAVLYWLVRHEVRAINRVDTLLHAVADATTDAVFVKSLDGKYLFFNEAAARFVGKPIEEVIGMDDTDLFDPASARIIRERDRRVIALGLSVTEEENLTAAGVTRTYLASKSPYRDRDGTIIGVLGISRDITDRKQAELAIRDSEAKFRTFVDQASESFFLFSTDGVIQNVNRTACESLGYRRDELIGQSVLLFNPEETPDEKPRLLKRLQAGETVAFETRHRRKNGTIFPVEISCRLFQEAGVEFVMSLVRDITDRKRVEEAIQASEKQFRELADAIPQIVYVTHPDGEIIYFNARGTAYTGKTYQHLLDQSMINLVHPEEVEQIVFLGKRILETGIPEDMRFRFRRADGVYRRHICRQVPVRDAEGKIVRWYGTLTDVEKQQQAEDAVREERDRFHRIAMVGPGVIHIWRTQLNGAMTFPYASPSVVDLFGFSPEELRVNALPIWEIIHPDDRPRVRESLQNASAKVSDLQCEYRVNHPHRGEIWIESRSSPVREPDGSLLWYGFLMDVTARKKAEIAIYQSRERLRLVLDNIPQGVVWKDRESRYLGCNRVVAQARGLATPDEIIGKTDYDFPSPTREKIDFFIRKDREVIQSGQPQFHIIESMNLANGRSICLSTNKVPWFEANGQIGGVLVTWEDVTERIQRDNALRESEERYRKLVDLLPSAIFLKRNGKITFCNPAFAFLVGASDPAAVLGRSPYDFFHTDELDTTCNRIVEQSRIGQPIRPVEQRLRRHDGVHVPVQLIATSIADGGRESILVVLNDLSERARSAELLQSVLGSVSDAIVTIDEQGTIQSVNPATEQIFGYPCSELVGQNVAILMSDPQRIELAKYMTDDLRPGFAKIIGTGREVVAQRKDGSSFPAELSVTEFYLNGRRHFTGVVRDVSERRKLEDQYRQAQKMEAVGQLAGGVAHDFNNLLTVINGFSEMLLTDLDRHDPNRDSLVAIRDAGDRAASLTQQLLAYSRKTVLIPKILDPNEIVADTGKLLRRLIGDDVKLTISLATGVSRIRFDPGQLGQVLMNLAINARDAMPQGGNLTIETGNVILNDRYVRSHPEVRRGHYVLVQVSDTGGGMSDEVKQHLFEPFFTTKEVGQGTGLGLATVYGLVKQSGGHIEVHSELGQGTSFHVYLPALETIEPIAEVLKPARVEGGRETILLVEDQPEVRKLARISLQSYGYSILEASDPAEALDLIDRLHPPLDLLLTDVVMPGMSGRQLAERLRPEYAKLKVLFMSGYTDDAVVRHGILYAEVAFLRKPYTPDSLAMRVRQLLDQH